ncbi:MAG: NADH-quinone oxidoreductase subunit J [Saprospiraceae bacterium]
MSAELGFYFLAAVAVLSALVVVFSRNAVYSVLALILTFFAIAGHYFMLNSQFLAAVHIIVYAGAIMVLFLYVIMMLNLNKDTEKPKRQKWLLGSTIASGLLILLLIASFQSAQQITVNQADANEIGLVENLGKVLYQQYLLPFEVSAILFLAGMVGAVMLGKRELK